MKRHYTKSINHLKNEMLEISCDIEAYVYYLEHQKSILVSELHRSNTAGGKKLLAEMGYKLS